MNIQEAASQSGLTPDTIRFYERKGVLPRPPRQANGYRNYTPDHVRTLRLAKGLRHLAVPLEAVAPMIAVAHSGTCGEVRGDLTGALNEALAETEQRLNDLTHVREHLRLILGGLTAMDPAATAVPGMAPCECIRLVTGVADE
ncbi:MAG: MerR family transcriptional regulator [Dehalococcoidia bacterium]|nr:MerR family transcriptional regulator [Dehalococcoidia bacterium]MCZ7579158.1 MerR family transcriptional regulator [Dehalococcoidia bacterium]